MRGEPRPSSSPVGCDRAGPAPDRPRNAKKTSPLPSPSPRPTTPPCVPRPRASGGPAPRRQAPAVAAPLPGRCGRDRAGRAAVRAPRPSAARTGSPWPPSRLLPPAPRRPRPDRRRLAGARLWRDRPAGRDGGRRAVRAGLATARQSSEAGTPRRAVAAAEPLQPDVPHSVGDTGNRQGRRSAAGASSHSRWGRCARQQPDIAAWAVASGTGGRPSGGKLGTPRSGLPPRDFREGPHSPIMFVHTRTAAARRGVGRPWRETYPARLREGTRAWETVMLLGEPVEACASAVAKA